MENRERNVSGLDALRALDSARNLEVDLSALRAKVTAKMSAEGLVFNAPTPTVVSSAEFAAKTASDNVVSLDSHKRSHPLRRNWLIGLSAAAAAAVVGFTGWATLFPASEGNKPTAPGTGGFGNSRPRLDAAGASLAVPGANDRLAGVGAVDFVAAETFSEQATQAPAYRVTKGNAVSSGEVQKVAQSLGISGAVRKNGSGYTVKDSTGATLTVTVGELTSLSFNNPAAVHMVCVPVKPEDGNVELPNPNRPKSPTPSFSSPSGNLNPIPSATPTEDPSQIELPAPAPTSKPTRPAVTPTQTPTESVPPAVRPGAPTPTVTPSETAAKTESPSELRVHNYYVAERHPNPLVEIGELHALAFAATSDPVTPHPSPETANPKTSPTSKDSDEVEPLSTQAPSPSPTNCIMKVVGDAPTSAEALAQVTKVASSLGATVVSSQVGASQKDGLTTLDVPVKMPGQKQAQTWRAVVSAQGLASIRANLGKETKLGDYQVISEKQAVERLNDPAYGPMDVFDPSGKATLKITGKINLVEAKLTNAPVKQKDGTIVSMPVYQLTDAQGRVWTVLAVMNAR